MNNNKDLDDFSSLVLQLYRLSHEASIDEFQDRALSLLKPAVAFDASMWGTATHAPEGIDVHTLHLHRKAPEMMMDYVPIKELDTAAESMSHMAQGTRAFHPQSWYSGRREREFLDFMHRYDQRNIFITTRQDLQTRFTHWITLFRSDPEAQGTAEEVGLLDRLAPHLMQALALNRVMHLERFGPTDGPTRGSAIADLRGVVYHADTAFETMMRTEWGDRRGGALPRLLLEHLLQGEQPYRGATVVVGHRVERGLLFIDSRERCRADGLTQRERTIALLVSKGDTYREIAATLHRSPATVRNHIQAIYEKLEVNNIAGLIEELRKAG